MTFARAQQYAILIIFVVAVVVYVVTGKDRLGIVQSYVRDMPALYNIGQPAPRRETTTRVTKIIDGDTFDIASGERVRLIGIDTPERGEFYYSEATAHLASLIADGDVTLVADVSERDRYGRLLRYVYVDDLFVNEKMIADGYAKMVTYPPDVAYAKVFARAQKNARQQHRGLWVREDNFTQHE